MKKSSISLFKSGKFYNAFGDDGVILHSLLGYKYVLPKQSVGFPESACQKVTHTLEEAKISYEIFEKDNKVAEYKGLNKNYGLILKSALSALEVEARINNLKKRILECSPEELTKIIEFLENGQFE